MATGRYVSDLEKGDEFEPYAYSMTPFVVREYAHGVEEAAEIFHGGTEGSPQLAPPTLIHIDKIRLLKQNCPGGKGPHARIHYQYSATHHAPVPVNERLVASGRVTDRYEKRGRDYLEITIELRRERDGGLLISYRDTAVLSFQSKEEQS